MDEHTEKKYFPKLVKVFDLLSHKYSDFDVTLKRLISLKNTGGTKPEETHSIVKVEATTKAKPSEVKQCEVDIREPLFEGAFVQVDVKCEHNDKIFRYTEP